MDVVALYSVKSSEAPSKGKRAVKATTQLYKARGNRRIKANNKATTATWIELVNSHKNLTLGTWPQW